jgi:hypothetical protein
MPSMQPNKLGETKYLFIGINWSDERGLLLVEGFGSSHLGQTG